METPLKPSEQVKKLKENLSHCPMAIEETVATMNRCEIILNNTDDKVEKYFAKEAVGVLAEMSAQLMSLASHPNINQIVDGADGL